MNRIGVRGSKNLWPPEASIPAGKTPSITSEPVVPGEAGRESREKVGEQARVSLFSPPYPTRKKENAILKT